MNNNDIKGKINQLYLLSQRDFTNSNFSQANLKGINLAGVNLNNSNLSFVNLENANLKGTNLSQCNLKYANLKGANLTDAILDGSDLSFSKLNGANFTNIHAKNSNFYQAYVNNVNAQKGYFFCTNFSYSSLKNSDFSQSNIEKGNLKNALLEGINLTQASLREANLAGTCLTSIIANKTIFRHAQYDQKTLFSRQFDPTKMDMIYQKPDQIPTHILVQVTNQIINASQKYLFASLVKKYWEYSQPNNDWINKFRLDDDGQAYYEGLQNNYLNDFQLQWYRRWIKNYVQLCSDIVGNFDELIQNDLSSLSSVTSELKLSLSISNR